MGSARSTACSHGELHSRAASRQEQWSRSPVVVMRRITLLPAEKCLQEPENSSDQENQIICGHVMHCSKIVRSVHMVFSSSLIDKRRKRSLIGDL
ncbi:hypothetical protein U9M48_001944 [Paspalum notatum var. saurae]|uniref:Uncharacterized protein n=1 Tax=Paspalum notatum var. saurae TaxID=547442 RepID=A0AAQ3PH21_PASNO